jgi:predicted lipid-binding transport protein (Tim44 family)
MFNGPFVDILIFAVLAIFLVFRLRSILGRRDGFEEDPNTKAANAFKTQSKPVLDTSLPSGEGIDAVVAADPSFSQQAFMDGAEQVYAMILTAFARGDMDELRPLLGYEMASSFSDVINERRKAGEELSITLTDLSRADLFKAMVVEGIATITVEYQSTQIRVLKDENGTIIDGDPDEAETFIDQWTFERDVGSENPNWLLVETQTAES